MKITLRLLSTFIVFFSLVSLAGAVETPNNLKLDSQEGNTVNLSWDTVDNAFMYYVLYDQVQGIDGTELESDYIETNSITISSLEDATYYFSVIAFDENASESMKSEELVVEINSTVVANQEAVVQIVDFTLDSAEVIAYDTIKLNFSEDLDNGTDAVREFNLVNKNDSSDTFEILGTEIDENNSKSLYLLLDREMVIGNEYEVVVVAINSTISRSIESGIDSIKYFTVNEIIVNPTALEETSTEEGTGSQEITSNGNDDIELNAAEEDSGVNGTDLSMSDIENNSLMIAKNTSNLPKTGPEHLLLIILTLILGALIFIFKHKKA